ncbi:hypothetical protein FRC10_003459 [Ceratobasidium sp. 414]|nr:hypothetical protein FRC10_003459 [Ceratobasidium sp. 414]
MVAMPRSTHRERLYRGHHCIYAFMCPRCGFRISADHIEHYCNAIRARREQRYGRYISVRQLRVFIEIARSQIDWDSAWVSMDDLYRIVEYVSQMDNEESMDIDTVPLAIHDVLNRLENLSMN